MRSAWRWGVVCYLEGVDNWANPVQNALQSRTLDLFKISFMTRSKHYDVAAVYLRRLSWMYIYKQRSGEMAKGSGVLRETHARTNGRAVASRALCDVHYNLI